MWWCLFAKVSDDKVFLGRWWGLNSVNPSNWGGTHSGFAEVTNESRPEFLSDGKLASSCVLMYSHGSWMCVWQTGSCLSLWGILWPWHCWDGNNHTWLLGRGCAQGPLGILLLPGPGARRFQSSLSWNSCQSTLGGEMTRVSFLHFSCYLRQCVIKVGTPPTPK